MFTVEQLWIGGYDDNFSYLIVSSNNEGVLVDPTGDINVIKKAVEKYPALVAKYILITHNHPDHTACVEGVKTFFNAPTYNFNSPTPTVDGEKLPLGDGYIEVIMTSGHSKDSVCYRLSDDSGLFTGDTLFIGCCGFCRPERMFNSLQKLKTLSKDLVVYSGHNYGLTPTATLGEECKTNPYLTTNDLKEFKIRLKDLH